MNNERVWLKRRILFIIFLFEFLIVICLLKIYKLQWKSTYNLYYDIHNIVQIVGQYIVKCINIIEILGTWSLSILDSRNGNKYKSINKSRWLN